jgi:hypothetical protein
VLHGGRFHRLSLEEAACLQGLPAGTHFFGAVNARFRQVGNAVPPPLANVIAKRLRALLLRYRAGLTKCMRPDPTRPSGAAGLCPPPPVVGCV